MWKSYETACTSLLSSGSEVLEASAHTLAMSRIMAHYLVNRAFPEEGALIDGAKCLERLPGSSPRLKPVRDSPDPS